MSLQEITTALERRVKVSLLGVDGQPVAAGHVAAGDLTDFLRAAYSRDDEFVRLDPLVFGGDIERHVAKHRIAEIQVSHACGSGEES